MRQAVVAASDKVVNVIEAPENWNGIAENTMLIPSETASPGDTWDGTQFTPAPIPPPSPEEIRHARLQELRDKGITGRSPAESDELLQLLADVELTS